jgi:hypothetical protein
VVLLTHALDKLDLILVRSPAGLHRRIGEEDQDHDYRVNTPEADARASRSQEAMPEMMAMQSETARAKSRRPVDLTTTLPLKEETFGQLHLNRSAPGCEAEIEPNVGSLPPSR